MCCGHVTPPPHRPHQTTVSMRAAAAAAASGVAQRQASSAGQRPGTPQGAGKAAAAGGGQGSPRAGKVGTAGGGDPGLSRQLPNGIPLTRLQQLKEVQEQSRSRAIAATYGAPSPRRAVQGAVRPLSPGQPLGPFLGGGTGGGTGGHASGGQQFDVFSSIDSLHALASSPGGAAEGAGRSAGGGPMTALGAASTLATNTAEPLLDEAFFG